ncbi:MAG TPA: phosphonate ABC transporter ATP-binding protein [Ruminiclostridium sp.]
MNTVLDIKNITKKYSNGVQALSDVSFCINEGEFVVIIGPSGSGKSTLLRSINKLIEISSGNIYIDGEDISKKRSKSLRLLRRKIGMIFQHYNLIYRLSVIQNVMYGRLGYMSNIKGVLGRYTEEDKLKAIELLKEIDLGDYIYNRAADLSGGQKQRVGIARAIMQQPKILLCDEPIASLDPSTSKIIMDLIYNMARSRNIACIVNLHQINVALKYATRIIGLSKGKIVFDGKPDQLDNATIEKIYNTSMQNLIISGELNEA